MTTRALVALACAGLFAACAVSGIQPNRPYEVVGKGVPPYQIHEDCVKLAVGDRLHWSFEAQAPLDFNIHYHEGNAVIMPVVRDKLTSAEGTFEPLVAQDYCLMWEAGARGTLLDYKVRLTRGKP